MSKVETKLNIEAVGRVCVTVSDTDRALDFYVGTLGFEKRLDAEFAEGQRWVEVAPPGAQTSIALVPRDNAPAGVEVSFATGDAAADHAALRAATVDADEEVLRMDFVPPMFTFRDRHGNRLRMVERD